MANSNPTTPETAPKSSISHPGVRRSSTLPTRIVDPTRTPPSVAPTPDAVETLYNHSFVKIVSFSVSSSPSSRPNSSAGPQSPQACGSDSTLIPWSSPTERTLAAGPLEIYRVPSTGVSFLRSGTFLRHVVAKSQMWCVDGTSKFVLKFGHASFYRIELPTVTEEDKEKIQEFKVAVAQILQLEKTPSPFITGQLETFERPVTPVRRKSLAPREKAKKWRLNKVWEPEDAEQRAQHRARLSSISGIGKEVAGVRRDSHLSGPGSNSNDSDDIGSYDGSDERDISGEGSGDGDASSLSETEAGAESKEADNKLHVGRGPIEAVKVLPRPRAFTSSRSLTAPLHLSINSTSPSKFEAAAKTFQRKEPDAISIASSRDSFHTVDEPTVGELPSSPTDAASFISAKQSHDDDIVEQFADMKPPSHSRNTSRTASTPNTPRPFRRVDVSEDRSNPSTPTLVSDSDDEASDAVWADNVKTPPDTIRLRRIRRRLSGASQRPALEPLPHPANLFHTPPRPPRKLGSALIEKTYSLLIGSPAHLVTIMIRIAQRIVHGLPIIYSPLTPRYARERIPGTWLDSSADEEDEWDDEDDFGIPLGNYHRHPVEQQHGTAPADDELEPDWGVD